MENAHNDVVEMKKLRESKSNELDLFLVENYK